MRVNRLISGMVFLVAMMFSGMVWSGAAETYTNSIGMAFVLIPSGSFTMGAPSGPDAKNLNYDEVPQHPVAISKAFYLGKYEVTQAQWESIMGNNPSEFKGADRPVEKVNFVDVQQFVKRLNEKEGTEVYRLPTEAEWEYAARAGTTTRFPWGESECGAELFAWYDANSGKQTHPVGQKQPNAWGLYDMEGNVWEWVQDWHDGRYYENTPGNDPTGPEKGSYRVFRGGSWEYEPALLRPSYRNDSRPDRRYNDLGFRLARTIP
ncbi:MAG: formylglycine-generating enzyme family protein [Magnetococcales bacterium]|nr:formylglycine-generating enzyme family protein [Magnetococcales bacterium]